MADRNALTRALNLSPDPPDYAGDEMPTSSERMHNLRSALAPGLKPDGDRGGLSCPNCGHIMGEADDERNYPGSRR